MNQMIKRSIVIGSNIRKFRILRNLTQEQLTAKIQIAGCDISRGTLAKIESGLRNISLDEINVLKLALSMSYDDFFKED